MSENNLPFDKPTPHESIESVIDWIGIGYKAAFTRKSDGKRIMITITEHQEKIIKSALKEEAHMSEIEEQLTKALGHVIQAEIIMEQLGHEKYSLSGMCSAAMRDDLEKEVSNLLCELAEARKQRDTLADALAEVRSFGYRSTKERLSLFINKALAGKKGGSHE
jgi:hypothetical protein